MHTAERAMFLCMGYLLPPPTFFHGHGGRIHAGAHLLAVEAMAAGMAELVAAAMAELVHGFAPAVLGGMPPRCSSLPGRAPLFAAAPVGGLPHAVAAPP